MRLLWKEWQQQKWIIFFGLLAGISFPVFKCLYMWKNERHFVTDSGSGSLLVGGVIFAIILAIATMHHDIRKGTDIFLQSKPVRLWKFYAIKYLLAAVLLYITFLVVISLDIATAVLRKQSFSFTWVVFCYTYPIALLLFSISLFLMAVTRDAAKTAFLAIWAMLLIYFLPLMFRGLEWMNLFEQIDNANQQPSVVQYLIWLLSLPEKITPDMAVYRPAGIPDSFYGISILQELLQIISSHNYQRYLLFVAAFGITTIIFVALTIKAMRYNWRWHPGQKSIVWTLGVSAAAIFGIAMFQVGHNLEPVKEINGKPLINPATYDWNYMPESLREGLPEGHSISNSSHYYDRNTDVIYIKDDLMFRITFGYQAKDGKDLIQQNEKVIRHFVLQIYQFPYSESNSASSGTVPNFVIGAMKISQTESITNYKRQQIFGCFVRENYLYTAYRPQLRDDEKNRIDLDNRPIYLSTIDISNPSSPQLVGSIKIKSTMNFCTGFANYGDHCYLSDGGQLVIISVAQAGKPEIIRQIPYVAGGDKCGVVKKETLDYIFELGDDPGFPSHRFSIVDNKMLCSSYTKIAILDLADPNKPEVIFNKYFDRGPFNIRDTIQDAALKDDILYLSNDNGIYVGKLTKQENNLLSCELIGKRLTTPIERLAGRRSGELLLSGDYLIEEAGYFGAIVYDVSIPSRPRRVYHAQVDNFASNIGFWNGLLFMQEYNYKTTFYQLPNSNNK